MMIVELQARMADNRTETGPTSRGMAAGAGGGGASVPLRGAPATRRGATTRTCFTQFVRESRNLPASHEHFLHTRKQLPAHKLSKTNQFMQRGRSVH